MCSLIMFDCMRFIYLWINYLCKCNGAITFVIMQLWGLWCCNRLVEPKNIVQYLSIFVEVLKALVDVMIALDSLSLGKVFIMITCFWGLIKVWCIDTRIWRHLWSSHEVMICPYHKFLWFSLLFFSSSGKFSLSMYLIWGNLNFAYLSF